MKKKVLSIALVCAIVLSCFSAVVFATDGITESTEVLGGVLSVTNSQYMLTDKVSGTGKQDSVNTPFKGIDFSGKESRNFKFVVYNDTNTSADIGVGYSWAQMYTRELVKFDEPQTETVTQNGKEKTIKYEYYSTGKALNRSGGSVDSGNIKTITLNVPSDVYWVNSDKIKEYNNGSMYSTDSISNGSNGNKVDGSGIGFRINCGAGVSGNLYMVCVGGDDVTEDEIKQINKNLSEITKGNGATSIATAITDWNESEITKSLLVEKNKNIASEYGFYAVNYEMNVGSAYYKRLFPAIDNVSADGETVIKSELTVYNNSENGIKVQAYPQCLWNDGKRDYWSDIDESVYSNGKSFIYMAPNTKHTFTIEIKIDCGKIKLTGVADDNNKTKTLLEDGTLFYRFDIINYQPDIDFPQDNTKEKIDITVFNESETKYNYSIGDKGTLIYTLPDYVEADENLKSYMKVFNGDLEFGNTKRWGQMQGTLGILTYDKSDATLGKYSFKYTTSAEYGSALFNVAPAIYNGEVADGIFNGGGAGLYKVSFMAKAESSEEGEDATGNYKVVMDIDTSGQTRFADCEQKTITMTDEWQTYRLIFDVTQEKIDKYFDATKKCSENKIQLRLDGSSTGGGALAGVTSSDNCTYYLDNVTIEKVEFDAKVESSLTVSDSLAFNVYAPTSVNKMDVTFNGEKTTLTPTADNGKHKFTFSGITPEKMADKITYVCYQEVTSGKYVTKKYETSVQKYLTSLLGNEKAGQLAIDTLNYGAMSQLFVKYNTDNLANKDLDENLQKAYESVEKPANDYSQTGEGFAWASASLQLEDTVNIKFNIKESDYKEDMVVEVNGTKLSNWEKSGDKMYVVYKGIKATKLGEKVTAKVMLGEAQVSKTLTYSVGTYVHRMWEKENVDLLKSLVKYGNSAVEYSAK